MIKPENNIKVSTFLMLVGNDYEWVKDWPMLLKAINYCNHTKYAGFIRNGKQYVIGDCSLVEGLLEWHLAIKKHILIGRVDLSKSICTS